jgi:translocation and assembly module TamB
LTRSSLVVVKRTLGLGARVLAALGLAVLFVVSAALGLLLHVDLPAEHRVAARALSHALSRLFYGKFKIGKIDRLNVDLDELDAKDVTVRDTYGNRVLKLSNLHVEASLPSIAEKLLFATGKINLVVRRVRVERADCEVITDPKTGAPTLAGAFTLVKQPTKPRRPPKPSARYVRVWLPQIEIGRVYARGRFGSLPTLEADLARVKGSLLGTPKGIALDVERFGAVVRGLGGTDVVGTSTVHVRAPGAIWSSFDGYFGEVEVGAFVRVDGKRLRATLDLPRLEPAAVKALWPSWPLRTAATLHAEAAGTLPLLATAAQVQMGDGKVSVLGPARVSGPNAGADLAVHAEHIDLDAFVAHAPKTDLSASAKLALARNKGQWQLGVSGSSEATSIAGQDVPAIKFDGTVDKSGFSGHATPAERGLPLQLAFSIHSDGVVDLEAHTEGFELENAPRLARYTRARGHAAFRVKAHIAHQRLDATVTGNVSGFSLAGVRMGNAELNGFVSGPLNQPEQLRVDASLSGNDLSAGLFSFGGFQIDAAGPVTEPRVKASLKDEFGPNIVASARVTTTGAPRVRDLSLAVTRAGAKLEGSVAQLDVSRGRVDIDHLQLSGAGGTLSGSLDIRPTSVEAHAQGDHLDMGEIGNVLGLPRGKVGGKLSIRADVLASKEASRGQVHVTLGNGSIMNVDGVAMSLNATLDQSRFSGDTQLVVRDVGSLGATWNTTLDGPLQKLATWKRIVGRVQFGVSNVHLDGLEHALPASLGVKSVKGRASGEFRVDREQPTAFPNVFAVAATEGLDAVVAPKGSHEAPLHIQGIDLQVGGAVSGDTGDTNATARLVYQGGALASASGTLRIDLKRLVKAPKSMAAQFETTPLNAVLTIPERQLSDFPQQIAPQALSGKVGGKLSLSGTLKDPTWSASLDATGLRQTGSRYAEPVDAKMQAQYVQSSGQFGANAEVDSNGRRLAKLVFTGKADWRALTHPPKHSQAPPWTGGAVVSLDGLPLQVIAPLAEERVAGQVFGTVALERQSTLPSISASVDVRGTSVDRLPIGNGKLTVRSDGDKLSATLDFRHNRGTLSASLRSMLDWSGTVPRVPDKGDVVVHLTAARYDAVVLTPLLTGILSDISGRIDADLSAVLAKQAGKDHELTWSARISGHASLENGHMQIAPLGLDLRDVSFHATAQSQNGATVIRVPDVVAKARSEKKNLKGSATLYLSGLRFDHGVATLHTDSVPVLVQGVTLATATGTLDAELKHEPQEMQVNVSVPNLVAKLPRATSRTLISLNANPDIKVLQPLGEPVEPSTGPVLPWHVTFSLGDVRITQNGVNVPVGGHPLINLGEKVAVGGYVDLKPGGQVPALNHVFLIDNGRISFDGPDPGNPDVDVTASWRSADGVTVYVEVKGRYKTAKLRLYSDPPMSQTDVLALLLGGPTPAASTATAAPSQTGGGSAQQAQAVNIGTQALGLNDLFSGTPLSSVQVSASTSQNEYGGSNQNPAYTAAVRISDKVWLEGTYEQGGAATSTGASASANNTSDAFTGAVDWRFNQHWSLRTEAGNASTSVDLLWHYRY